MYNYIKKSLFCLLFLIMPYMNLASNSMDMYQDLVKEEIRLTTRMSKVQPCVHAKANVKIEDRTLQPFRAKEEEEALLRKLQIAKAKAELNLLTNPKK